MVSIPENYPQQLKTNIDLEKAGLQFISFLELQETVCDNTAKNRQSPGADVEGCWIQREMERKQQREKWVQVMMKARRRRRRWWRKQLIWWRTLSSVILAEGQR
ncbi:hypothetical protein D4764_13G0011770 [Takifugu flavidus]|uniref:Uncharacterized protein n=1 Tax=Takifugu flavidus TaxID=433684 RepID=A0A5C6PAW5_9TELE|nr:hypothetical protein D4764_13G0011770 [Takifugu flavidus]